MHRSAKLIEGMREGDLADLVLPLISVDQYESKVDASECIVFGFYVHDKDAANDLNRFLQKSSIQILDTEVSPAPDQMGFYMVFIELMDNDRLEENVSAVLAEIKTLVDIEKWDMRVRDADHLIPFSEENLRDSLKKLSKHDKKKDVLEFLRPSLLSNVEFENDLIILEGCGDRCVLRFLEFDRTSVLLEQQLHGTPVGLSLRTVAKTNRIRRMLGDGWDVSMMGRHTLVQHADDPRSLLLV